jgi:3-deoxy-D-manno-octulosonic-acid transferase
MYLFLIFLSYQILQIIALPIIILYIIVRARKKSVFGNFIERLGFVPKPTQINPPQTSNTIWVHAVSVGETLATEYLVNKIKQEIPGVICYQTTGTVAGRSMITKNIKPDYASFLPFDFLPCMLLAFSRIKPSAIIIIEAEQWPNLLMLAHYKNIPVYALSARLSTRSFRRFKFFSCIFRPLFNLFTKIFAQTELDAQRFAELGIAPEKITVLGDLKAFNVLEKRIQVESMDSIPVSPERRQFPSTRTFGPPSGQTAVEGTTDGIIQGISNAQTTEIKKFLCSVRGECFCEASAKQKCIESMDSVPLTLLVGSVHPGELDVYLELFTTLKQEFTELKIIIAPRHFHWKQELVQKINAQNLSSYLWDETNQTNTTIHDVPDILNTHDVLLVCKLGVLFDLYQFADIFYLGGTFVPVGGHNLLEPAVWGVPSFVGPYHANCKAHADALEQAHGLLKVQNTQELITQTEKLLQDKQLRLTMIHNSRTWLVHEAAVVEDNLAVLFRALALRRP